MIKDKFPDDLKDILKKYQKEWYKDDPHKDLYADWIQKYPSEDLYKPKELDVLWGTNQKKKNIFKETAQTDRLKAKLRARAGERLPIDVSGGFAVGQLVGVSGKGHGVILGFYRHDAFPYENEDTTWFDKREDLSDDGSSIRAEVLINGEFHRVPLPNMTAPTEGTS